MIRIQVFHNGIHNIHISSNPEITIKELKEQIRESLLSQKMIDDKITVENIVIMIAGKQSNDELTIQETEIYQLCCIQAIIRPH